MPRSMAEIAIALPDATLVAHPVLPRQLQGMPWWLRMGAARTLSSSNTLKSCWLRRGSRCRGCSRARNRPSPLRNRTVSRLVSPSAGRIVVLILRSVLFSICFYVLTAIFLIVGSPLLLGPRSWAMAGLRMHARVSLGALRVITGTRLEVRGGKAAQVVLYLVAAKHQSAWDTFGSYPSAPIRAGDEGGARTDPTAGFR